MPKSLKMSLKWIETTHMEFIMWKPAKNWQAESSAAAKKEQNWIMQEKKRNSKDKWHIWKLPLKEI